MARLLVAVCGILVVALASAAPQQQPQPQQGQPQQPQQPQQAQAEHQQEAGIPNINWGHCENLQPSAGERESKKLVIQKCLDVIPIPEGNVTARQADVHRVQITSCALKAEGWFNEDGSYKYNRAREEIKTKKLTKKIEGEIIQQHDVCHEEAIGKFPNENVQQIQLYQACMDYHIARICNIQVLNLGDQEGGQEGGQDGGAGAGQASPDYYQ